MTSETKYLMYCGYKFKHESSIPTRVTCCYLTPEQAEEFSQWYREKIFPMVDEQIDKIRGVKCEQKLKK